MAKKQKKQSKQELLQDLIDKVEMGYKFMSEPIERARNNKTFLYVDQWEPNVRYARENASKPVMTFNRLVPIMRGIIGDQRKNTPAVDVRDITTNITIPQATVDNLNDYIRELAYKNNFDVILQTVFTQFMECGWGAARVRHDYDGDTFNQIIIIDPIVDVESVFWDPLAQKDDKSDGDYCGVYEIMSKQDFENDYPNIEDAVSAANNEYYLPWIDDEAIIVCEIYVKEYFNKKIYQLSDGNSYTQEEAEAKLTQDEGWHSQNPAAQLMGVKPLEIIDERTIRDYKIKYYKFIQNHLLHESEWPGKILPIPYGEGDSTIIDGQRIPLGYLTEAFDAQKLYNYVMSETAYAILRARKEQWLTTPQQIEGFEDIWKNPDNVQGALPYNPDPLNPGAKPERIDGPTFPSDLINLAQYVSNDTSNLTGIKDEAMGQETNAISGTAIAKRQDASSKPVNVYQDNLARFAKNIFKIVLDILPNIMDTPNRKITVRSADNKSRVVTINKPTFLKPDGSFNVANDFTQGQFDIEVRVDGSYDAQKAAALDFLIRLAAINPQIANLIPDLMAENSGLENAQKLIQRLQTLLPPQILAQEQGKPPPPPPPPPPPDPKVVAAQLKLQGDQQNAALRQKELQLELVKLQQEAQKNGWDFVAAMNKANAEVIKSRDAVTAAHLDHANTVNDGINKLTQNMQQAQIRHVELQAQSQALKGTNV